MSQLFARIELGGFPNERSYESLHRFMDELNWHRQVSKWQLPYATYHATFKEEAPNVTSIATMLKDVRRRVMASVARALYTRGKSSYDKKQFAEASGQLKELLAVLNDPDLEGQSAGTDDLKQLAEGFIRLAEIETTLAARAAAPPPPPPAPAPEAPAPKPPDPTAATVTKIVVYSASDTLVAPPVEIERRMPPWVPPPVIARSNAEYRGELEVVVNEIGAVESASMTRTTVPSYDLTLLDSARRWRFRPATLNGQAVKYRLTYNVALTPRR